MEEHLQSQIFVISCENALQKEQMGIKFTKSVMLNQIKEIYPKEQGSEQSLPPPAWSCTAMLEDCHAMLCLVVPDKKWVGIKFKKTEKIAYSFQLYMYYTKGKELFELLMKSSHLVLHDTHLYTARYFLRVGLNYETCKNSKKL